VDEKLCPSALSVATWLNAEHPDLVQYLLIHPAAVQVAACCVGVDEKLCPFAQLLADATTGNAVTANTTAMNNAVILLNFILYLLSFYADRKIIP